MILPIVEGKSEVEAVPILLRRLLHRLERFDIEVARPFRVHRYRVVKADELERAVSYGLRSREEIRAVMLLLDADDDDPEVLESALLARCRQATPLPCAVVLARRELEAWFLGSKDSLRGICGIRPDANAPPEPEDIRGAKERLTRNMGGRSYLEVDDQPVMAAHVDIARALERCPSFRRFSSELERLISELGRLTSGSNGRWST